MAFIERDQIPAERFEMQVANNKRAAGVSPTARLYCKEASLIQHRRNYVSRIL